MVIKMLTEAKKAIFEKKGKFDKDTKILKSIKQ